jgi:S1-C subfamily serine protease
VRVGGDGSGTVVSSDGLILTADHVVPADNSGVDIHFADGRTMRATVVERSKRLDVALLRISADQSIPFVEIEKGAIADSQSVWAIGYPLGRLDPQIREAKTKQIVLDELITTWNNVSGGDSGGALLDARGHFVGVILGPGDPHRRTLRAASSRSVRSTFPILVDSLP